MSTIVIYGASDDLVEIEGNAPGCDEYNAEDATFIVSGVHDDRTASTKVRVKYGADGLWSITTTQLEEGHPALPCVLDSGNGYSMIANFDDVVLIKQVEL